jgi:hypothetical protein
MRWEIHAPDRIARTTQRHRVRAPRVEGFAAGVTMGFVKLAAIAIWLK